MRRILVMTSLLGMASPITSAMESSIVESAQLNSQQSVMREFKIFLESCTLLGSDVRGKRLRSFLDHADKKKRDLYRLTALFIVVRHECALHRRVLARLIKRRVNLNALDTENDVGKTALMHAVERHKTRTMAQLLLAGADPNAQNKHNGRTALIVAVINTACIYESVVRLLLDHGADPGVLDDRTPIAVVAEEKGYPAIAILIRQKFASKLLDYLWNDRALRLSLLPKDLKLLLVQFVASAPDVWASTSV